MIRVSQQKVALAPSVARRMYRALIPWLLVLLPACCTDDGPDPFSTLEFADALGQWITPAGGCFRVTEVFDTGLAAPCVRCTLWLTDDTIALVDTAGTTRILENAYERHIAVFDSDQIVARRYIERGVWTAGVVATGLIIANGLRLCVSQHGWLGPTGDTFDWQSPWYSLKTPYWSNPYELLAERRGSGMVIREFLSHYAATYDDNIYSPAAIPPPW